MGSVTGQAGANVTITGSYTIPAMKKVGYAPYQAGAIEAAASTGGPIIPPVMGVAAFLITAITGISVSKDHRSGRSAGGILRLFLRAVCAISSRQDEHLQCGRGSGLPGVGA